MRRTFLAAMAGFLLGVLATPAFTANPDDAIGNWRHPENGSIISVYKCGGGICAKVTKVADPSRKDENNPDPALRNRPVEGIVIMENAEPSGEKAWKGNLYNTQDGKTYSGSITLLAADQLKIEGCFLAVFCKSVVWTKEPAQ